MRKSEHLFPRPPLPAPPMLASEKDCRPVIRQDKIFAKTAVSQVSFSMSGQIKVKRQFSPGLFLKTLGTEGPFILSEIEEGGDPQAAAEQLRTMRTCDRLGVCFAIPFYAVLAWFAVGLGSPAWFHSSTLGISSLLALIYPVIACLFNRIESLVVWLLLVIITALSWPMLNRLLPPPH